jgi:DNA-binding transcriptional LysR family regulator
MASSFPTLAGMTAPDRPPGFHVGFVPGVTPDKWARAWAERMPRRPLDLVPLAEDADPVALLRDGDLSMALVRLPVDTEALHLIRLYDEQPVVVVAREHPVAAYDEIDVADLADEHRLPDAGTSTRQAVAAVADEVGVLVVPMSVARLHHRRDVVHVPVTGVAPTTVGLAWPRDLDDDRADTFVGVVRGRTVNSSRDAPRPPQGRRRRR